MLLTPSVQGAPSSNGKSVSTSVEAGATPRGSTLKTTARVMM
jgi:hypothetical protein